MILLILVISLVLIIGGAIFADKCWEYEEIGIGGIAIGCVAGITSLIITICLLIDVSGLPAIEKQIVMYQEENIAIESRIEETVKAYQKYEKDVFDGVSTDNVMAAVTLYPELKSDTLVQKQIETYVANNNKIKELKGELIYGDVYKWWLYFGGGSEE